MKRRQFLLATATATGLPFVTHRIDRVDNIRVPFLIVVGDRDPFMSVADCAELRQRVASSELLAIPNGTHPAYQERPDLFIPALDRFLNQTA